MEPSRDDRRSFRQPPAPRDIGHDCDFRGGASARLPNSIKIAQYRLDAFDSLRDRRHWVLVRVYIDAQRRDLLRRLREVGRAVMEEEKDSDAALLLEGIVLRLQADLRWLHACEIAWTKRSTPR